MTVPFGRDSRDRRSPLRQGRADEVTDDAVEVGVLTSRFSFNEAHNRVRHLPLHRIQRFFAGLAFVKDEISPDMLRKV
ncbi:MAG: hypothetical protein NVS2B16_30550 [Chloroflexota bacterium]